MKKTGTFLLALFLAGALSTAAYAENTGVARDTCYFVTAQNAEPAEKEATDAAKAPEEKKTQVNNASKRGAWNWNETIHDY